jgi:hypothetical protein
MSVPLTVAAAPIISPAAMLAAAARENLAIAGSPLPVKWASLAP